MANEDHESEAKRQIERAEVHGLETFTRSSNWLLAANSGALLLCLNALLNSKICDWAVFRPLTELFALGAVLAFFVPIANAMTWSIHALSWLQFYQKMKDFSGLHQRFAERHTQKIPPTDLDWAELKKASRPLDREMGKSIREIRNWKYQKIAVGTIFVGSGLAFATASTWALRDVGFRSALCTAQLPSKAVQ